jgi:hypothetical protein
MDRATEFPPRPRWQPLVPVDIQRTARTMAVYLDDKRSFVIFEHGTCVVVSESDQPVEEAAEILERILHAHPDMNTAEMRDRNWTVQYAQPAMSIVFSDEIEEHWDYIEENHLDGLTRDEVLIGPTGERNRFDREGKIGLFGRARMFLDASSPVAVGVWRPRLGLQPLPK